MSEWPLVPLGDLVGEDGFAIGPFGSRMKRDNYTDSGARVLRGTNITSDGRISGDFVYVSDEFADALSSARLRRGDIALPHRGAIGRAALVRSEDLVMSTSLMRVRLDPRLAEPAFVAAFLASADGQREILQFASTVGTPGIGQPLSSLRKVAVPLPPLDEQRRIAAVLGALEDLIETDRGLITRLRAQASAAFAAACDGGEEVPFSELAHLVKESVRPAAIPLGTPYLGLEHFGTDGEGLIGRGDAATVGSGKSRFVAGDVLYGKLRPYFRKFDRPGFDGVCSTEIWVLRPRSGWGANTVYAVVSRPEFTDFAMSGSGGTRMPRADWKHVATMKVRVPAASRRQATEKALQVFWQGQVALHDEIGDLTRTRDELLPLLMSGRVRVADLEGVS